MRSIVSKSPFFSQEFYLKQKIPVIILIAVSLVLLAVITPSYLHNRSHEISNNQLIASHIYSLIEGNIERPIGITSGLSSDEFLIRALEREENTNENYTKEKNKKSLPIVPLIGIVALVGVTTFIKKKL